MTAFDDLHWAFGEDVPSARVPALTRIAIKAREVKNRPGNETLSKEKCIVQAMKESPELYDSYERERQGLAQKFA